MRGRRSVSAAGIGRHMEIPGIQTLWAAAGGWQAVLLLLGGVGLGLTALGLRWRRRRRRRMLRRRSPGQPAAGQPAPGHPPAGARGRASLPEPPAPSTSAAGRQPAFRPVPATPAGGEFTGLLTPGRPWSAWQWDVYRQLQAGLNSGEYLPRGRGTARIYIHPQVQVGALLGGEAARQCDPQRFWRLHALSFEFVALTGGGQVVCAFEPRAEPGGRPGATQLLKRRACQAVGLPLHDTCLVWQGSDVGQRSIGAFIEAALRQLGSPRRRRVAARDEARAFLQRLELRERLFGTHGGDRFFFECLQPLARRHGLLVFCQIPLPALLKMAPGTCLQLQQLSIDYTLCDDNGDIVALVELDGSSHNPADAGSLRRDGLKNHACAAAGVRLVRVQRHEGSDDYTDLRLHALLEQVLFQERGLHLRITRDLTVECTA